MHLLIFLLLILICSALPDLEPLDVASAIVEVHLEEYVSILKQAFLERDNHELAGLEVLPDHQADVLCVRQVQGRVNFIQDVEGCRMILQEG